MASNDDFRRSRLRKNLACNALLPFPRPNSVSYDQWVECRCAHDPGRPFRQIEFTAGQDHERTGHRDMKGKQHGLPRSPALFMNLAELPAKAWLGGISIRRMVRNNPG